MSIARVVMLSGLVVGSVMVSGCGHQMLRCSAASGSWAIGRVADQSVLDRIQAESHASQLRTLADGETSGEIGMDRVTVHVNAQNLITAVTCD
ncbi:hypothetical protein [Pseudoxanthomonas sp. JBR18]|uniref:hypothetical protein n=1 Tax=Pseudoxanthomonas sp. JBR18 TaxID=2969308 RepID=UPI00230515E4|nr:hypothetical protein [Pseudoxanthomonas sp. JBR18]WCE02795.1 hypothetical protein PJ250_11620 [Pseudoxanthomonas sp. JBR18]